MRLRRIRLVSGIIIPVSLLAGVFGTVFAIDRVDGDTLPNQARSDLRTG